MTKAKITIGLIGGYGLEEILEKKKWLEIKNKYSPTSIRVVVGIINNKKVALICRHGQQHSIPPHKINHLANIWAFYNLGVKFIITTAAVGIINKKIKSGSFILPDDFIDFRFQVTTFYDEFKKELKHIDMTSPYSQFLREKIKKAAKNLGIKIYDRGIYINTLGPRFETPAEVRTFRKLGADIVGMTNVPEVILANELGIKIATIAISANWAAGIDKKPLNYQKEVKKIKNKEKQLNQLIKETIKII